MYQHNCTVNKADRVLLLKHSPHKTQAIYVPSKSACSLESLGK